MLSDRPPEGGPAAIATMVNGIDFKDYTIRLQVLTAVGLLLREMKHRGGPMDTWTYLEAYDEHGIPKRDEGTELEDPAV